jgi:hypothetical protein
MRSVILKRNGDELRAEPVATANGPAGPWLISNVGQNQIHFMRALKVLTLLSLAFTLTCSGREYTVDGAMAAASSVLPKDQPKKFALYNVRDATEKPQTMLEFLRAGKGSKAFFAVSSPKNEYIRDLLVGALKIAKKESFAGLNLIIVGDRVQPEMFESILKDRGISLSYAAY